jgi:Zn-dependent protease
LFISVLLHELAHCYAAFRVGGHADEIVIGPLGGLAPVFVPHEPQRELVTALAGPMVNFLIWVSLTPVLLMMGSVDVTGLLNPLRPHEVIQGEPYVIVLKLTFWLNWILLLVNLLPAFPFDGGRVLRSLLWPVFGYRPAIIVVSRLAKGTALLLCIIAWAIHVPDEGLFVPPWVPLVLIALFLYFSAKQEVAHLDQQEIGSEMFGYDFSQGYTSLEREEPTATRVDQPGVLQRWIAKRREDRERYRRQQEADEEYRVDAILARLHAVGYDGLSSDERSLLKRVSARYRNRAKD